MASTTPAVRSRRVRTCSGHARRRLALRTSFALLGMVALSGLGPAQLPAQERGAALASERRPLLVLAASSMTDVLAGIGMEWDRRQLVPVRFSFDATSRLAPQVAAGAPADVFVSADEAWIRWLEERSLVDRSAARVIAQNRLVFVVPRGRDGPSTVAGLGSLGTVALAGESVPAGRYAREALTSGGVWDELKGRVVVGGSVRGVLEWVARGEVDGGIVYRTDALAEPEVQIAFAFDFALHTPIRYSAAPLARSVRHRSAVAFVDYLGEPGPRTRFDEAGFALPSDGAIRGAGQVQGAAAFESTAAFEGAALPSLWAAVRLSLFVALLATAAGFVPAVPLGWLFARHDFRGKALASTLVLAPLVVPPVVTGFLLLTLLGREGPIGGLLARVGIAVPFTIVGATIAAFVVGLPLYVLSVRGAFEAVDPQLEELSRTLGAPPARTFRRISLPLALPGIAAGAILAFARALGEFGATVVLAGNVEGSTRTIALAVYTLLEAPSGRELTWALVAASVALSLLALLGFEMLSSRQRRRVRDDHGR